jgi:protein-tyrosine phosphatase
VVKILTVCTGNICRSPYAERYLQDGLDAVAPGRFEVRSAGTQALVGHPMDRRSAELLAEVGGSAEGFASRQLDERLLAGADFALALTTVHRDAIVARSPRMLKRAFTVREFARVLRAVAAADAGSLPRGSAPDDVEARWKALPKLASLRRHGARAAEPGGDDVVDPYRESSAVYARMVDEMLPALRDIVAFERAAARG